MAKITLFFILVLATLCYADNCFPENWSHAWLRVGNVWYTKLDTPRSWLEQVKKCKELEPGRSTIGSIQSKQEQDTVTKRFPTVWLGGFEIVNTGQWFWWGAGEPKPIQQTYWRGREPNDYNGQESCIVANYVAGKGGWDDNMCQLKRKALCELRC